MLGLASLLIQILCCCVHSAKERNSVDLDDEGGQTFLRVLIHLIMQDYPPLVSGSLQLIFKHFSQRAEVLQAFKQVSLSLILLICSSYLLLSAWRLAQVLNILF